MFIACIGYVSCGVVLGVLLRSVIADIGASRHAVPRTCCDGPNLLQFSVDAIVLFGHFEADHSGSTV
jgi:hypothetical protein